MFAALWLFKQYFINNTLRDSNIRLILCLNLIVKRCNKFTKLIMKWINMRLNLIFKAKMISYSWNSFQSFKTLSYIRVIPTSHLSWYLLWSLVYLCIYLHTVQMFLSNLFKWLIFSFKRHYLNDCLSIPHLTIFTSQSRWYLHSY